MSIVPPDGDDTSLEMVWKGDTALPDVSNLDEDLDRNISIMYAQLGIKTEK